MNKVVGIGLGFVGAVIAGAIFAAPDSAKAEVQEQLKAAKAKFDGQVQRGKEVIAAEAAAKAATGPVVPKYSQSSPW